MMFYMWLWFVGVQVCLVFLWVGVVWFGVCDMQCVMCDGCVIYLLSGCLLLYGVFVDDVVRLLYDLQLCLKLVFVYMLIGCLLYKFDVFVKVDGSVIFGIDVQVFDMLVGVLMMVLMLNGKLSVVKNCDVLCVMLGVVDVVVVKDVVIVVVQIYWQVKKVCDVVDIVWDVGLMLVFDSMMIFVQCKGVLQVEYVVVVMQVGEFGCYFVEFGNVVEVDYYMLYIVYVMMEFVNVIVYVWVGEIEVWGLIQGQDKVCWMLLVLFGVLVECVIVNMMFFGGSFGCKYVFDFVVYVVVVLKVVGWFVKVICLCEDDICYGFYWLCVFVWFCVVFGCDGLLVVLYVCVVGYLLYVVIKCDCYDKVGGWDEMMFDGLYDFCYDVLNLLVDFVMVMQLILVSFMCSVGSMLIVFFFESFVNEFVYMVWVDLV